MCTKGVSEMVESYGKATTALGRYYNSATIRRPFLFTIFFDVKCYHFLSVRFYFLT